MDAQYAEEHFSDLIAAAYRGEEVEIAAPEKPELLLKAKAGKPEAKAASGKRVLGAWRGMIELPTDEEWAAMDREIENEMVNGPLISNGSE